jgi:hypothetical protein
MQIIKKKEILDLIGTRGGLLSKAKEVLVLYLIQFQPFRGLTRKADLEKIVHKPPRLNPYSVYPRFQLTMHKIRQLSR